MGARLVLVKASGDQPSPSAVLALMLLASSSAFQPPSAQPTGGAGRINILIQLPAPWATAAQEAVAALRAWSVGRHARTSVLHGGSS